MTLPVGGAHLSFKASKLELSSACVANSGRKKQTKQVDQMTSLGT